MNLLERFLKYAGFDTRSDENSPSCPSTSGQLELLRELASEMRAIGLCGVAMDANGYLFGTIPATPGCEDRPIVGFLAHVDTSPDMPGGGVKPGMIRNYDGGDIPLGNGFTMRAADFPELAALKGQTIIHTDGTTLLGADDKAGIAAIMTAAEHLITHPEIPHGTIRIGFTPDEEIGRGADRFDVAAFGADFAYTVDGGAAGELEYENFNAAEARITVRGCSAHPGSAKGLMVNALGVCVEFDSMVPPAERPERTEGREGFYHLTSLAGDVAEASMSYILRDFERAGLERRKGLLTEIAAALDAKYGAGTAALTLRDQYYNMREVIERHPGVIEKAERAMRQAGVEPRIVPIRGGTDGARLSYMGLPCPNLFTGGDNFHSRYEYVSLEAMEKSAQTIVNLARLWGTAPCL